MDAQQITWTDGPAWTGEFEGATADSGVSLIFTRHDRVGDGPGMHRHPYPETFIVRRGVVEFVVGRRRLEAAAGQIVVVPAHTPHRFVGKTDAIEMIDVHASPNFITEWLD